MSEFKFEMRSGECPGGTITLTKGNAGNLCNMFIDAGYDRNFKQASIDLNTESAKQLIGHLQGLLTIEQSDRDRYSEQ